MQTLRTGRTIAPSTHNAFDGKSKLLNSKPVVAGDISVHASARYAYRNNNTVVSKRDKMTQYTQAPEAVSSLWSKLTASCVDISVISSPKYYVK